MAAVSRRLRPPALEQLAVVHIGPAVLLSGDVYLRDSLAPTTFAMALLTAFAVIALVLGGDQARGGGGGHRSGDGGGSDEGT